MAMPTSAVASAGASFTPSPTMATVWPSRCSSCTFDALSSGWTSANTSVDVELRAATPSATARASPVSIATSMPRACRSATASSALLADLRRRWRRRRSRRPPSYQVDRPPGPGLRLASAAALQGRRAPRAIRWRRAAPDRRRKVSAPSTLASTPSTGERAEPLGARHVDPPLLGAPARCRCAMVMFRIGFDRGGEAQGLVFAQPPSATCIATTRTATRV